VNQEPAIPDHLAGQRWTADLMPPLMCAVLATDAGCRDVARWALRSIAPKADRLRMKLAEQEAARKAEFVRAVALQPPADQPTPHEIKRLQRAERSIRNARVTGGNVAKASDKKVEALQAIATRQDMRWMHARVQELVELERPRGGEVIVDELVTDVPVLKDGTPIWKRGRKVTRQERVLRPRITNRDGLETLLAAGALDPIQYAALMRYRALYEAADPLKGLTPPDPDSGGSSAGDPFGSKALWAVRQRAAKRAAIARLEVAVASAAGYQAVWLIREVAGKGTTIRSICDSGTTRGKYALKVRQSANAILKALAPHEGAQKEELF